jgi:parallel beta-helix repeat protein
MPSLSRRAFALAPALAAASIAALVPSAHAATACDKTASPSGSDSAPGTPAAPYRSLSKLNATLRSGQTGCLRAGTWHEDLYVRTSGVTITSYPGERATVVGQTSVGRQATGATVADLDLVGRDVSPLVYGDNTTFRGNDVTNNHAGQTCFLIGDHTLPAVRNARIEANVVHDCGRLPSTNLDHGIYVLKSDGATITLNTFYGNADWGVHLYPNSNGTEVTRNIIDGNGKGVTFSGTDGEASRGNVVEHNLITNSTLQDNIMSYWGGAGIWLGGDLGNVARDNCVWGGKTDGGGINTHFGGFTSQDNVVADPQYVDREHHDYHLSPSSPCLQLTGDIAAEQAIAPKRTSAAVRRIVIGRPRAARHGRLRLKGRVIGPHHGGRRVLLQYRRGGHWKRAAVARVRSNGRFGATVRARHGGRMRLRAIVPGYAASRPLLLRVRA